MTTELATNPFQGAITQRDTQTALGDSEQSRAIAETQAAMVIAKRFPRNAIKAMDAILNACTRPTLAESALYTYSRGGTDITGPSIRLAEAMAQAWGNMQFGIRELEQRNGESTVEAFAWDMETNTRQVKTFQVRHERHTKKGVNKLSDPRDIYELTANQGARRLRACILGVIPGDVTESAVKQCETTMKAKAEVTTDSLAKLIEAFAAYGVTKEHIEKRIQRRLNSMVPAQLVSLRKIYNSLKDGMSTPQDWFDLTDRSVTKPTFSDPAPEITEQKEGETVRSPSGEIKAVGEEEPPALAGAQHPDHASGPGEPPASQAETQQEQIALALSDMDIKQPWFIDGLKRLYPTDVAKRAAFCVDLSDTFAKRLLEEIGLDSVIERIKE